MGNRLSSGNKTSTSSSQKSSKREEVSSPSSSVPTAVPPTTTNATRAFEPLSSRAVTFDERCHRGAAGISTLTSAGSIHINNSEFKPLRRAMTHDSRVRSGLSSNPLSTVQDVLYRRHFNATPIRQDTKTLFRVSECLVRDTDVVIIVDPFSSGAALANVALERGLAVVAVYSDTLDTLKDLVASSIPDETKAQFTASLYHDGSKPLGESLPTTLEALAELRLSSVVAVIAGNETGTYLTDALSEALGLRTNGTNLSNARRNKFAMGEAIKEKGLRTVSQCSCTTWTQVKDFVKSLGEDDDCKVVVLKPEESTGSEDVFLCDSIEKVQEAFGIIQGKINHFGLVNKKTLVQQYVEGDEYVVDTVSRDGKHKVVGIWKADVRPANDASFVYYGCHLVTSDGGATNTLKTYVSNVLDALEITDGPAHATVKMVNDPCLISARCHGGSGNFMSLENKSIGYNQLDVTLDAYVDAEKFETYPEVYYDDRMLDACCEVSLVSFAKGFVEETSTEVVESLPSFLSSNLISGRVIVKTTDGFSSPGSIMLCHADKTVVQADYDRIRELESAGTILNISDAESSETTKRIYAVVDPFSTGAFVAQAITNRGYDCICVYSDNLENIEAVASLVPKGVTLNFVATVGFGGSLDEIKSELLSTVKALNGTLAGIVPGAETGVRLTDQLTNELNLRGNIYKNCDARRDKYAMGETLREAGVRAVMQAQSTTWEEARDFITNTLKPSPFKVVLKPLESAGSDGVTLCFSLQYAEEAFRSLIGKVNGVGLVNEAVLIQEYLEGTEYVVDTVSRDGKHKVVAVWQYDKRPVNGAAFVYFCVQSIPVTPNSIIEELITYQLTVLDALGIRNGPGHAELKYFKNEPVLVEVGARCHGGEGTWIPIADRCVGYNQVDMFLDAYDDVDLSKFEAYPDVPSTLLASGCEAKFVNYNDGILKGMPGLEEIKNFPSFYDVELFVKPGDRVRKTVDMFSIYGSVVLLHDDADVLNANLDRVRELEHSGLFEILSES